jgi:hypothetical protein
VNREPITLRNLPKSMCDVNGNYRKSVLVGRLKAMLHGAIFLATCNAILLLRDVKLPNTSLHYTPLMFSL